MTGGEVVDPARTKRALDRVFGDVLPDTTRDDQLMDSDAERQSAQSGVAASRRRDEELLREVPPHHAAP